jgi:hypothetical protein
MTQIIVKGMGLRSTFMYGRSTAEDDERDEKKWWIKL